MGFNSGFKGLMNVVVENTVLLLPIQMVAVSDFYPVTGYRNRHFRCFT